MMAQAKRIYILMIKVKKFFSFFRREVFWKKQRACFSCFCRVIETLVKVWENSTKVCKHLRAVSVPTAFLVLPNFHSRFYNSIEKRPVHVFYLINVISARITPINITIYHIYIYSGKLQGGISSQMYNLPAPLRSLRRTKVRMTINNTRIIMI